MPTVSDAPGFAPDASLVLREHDAAVLSYERGEHGASGPADRPIVLTRVGPNGRVLFPPRVIEGTRSMEIDAAPVSWSGGTAVVFGESVATAPGLAPARRESVWFLDGSGRPVRAPLELTHEARDDGRGEPTASLAAGAEGLVAAWTVADGDAAGVWTRGGITLTTRQNTPAGIRGAAARAASSSVRVLAGTGFWDRRSRPGASPRAARRQRVARREAASRCWCSPRRDLAGVRAPAHSGTRSSRGRPAARWCSPSARPLATTPGNGLAGRRYAARSYAVVR